MAHLFVCPVLSSFTGMNLIMPYKISISMGVNNPTMIASKGRMVETPKRNKDENKTAARDTKRKAHRICTPIGIFAKARFNACKVSTAADL